MLAGPVFNGPESQRLFVLLFLGVPVSIVVAGVIAWLVSGGSGRTGGARVVRFSLLFLPLVAVGVVLAYLTVHSDALP